MRTVRILVTGASGFVGSLLIPRLQTDGHRVRAFGRDSARIQSALAQTASEPEPARAPERAGEQRRQAGSTRTRAVELMRGDALDADSLARALADIEVAYYLIHSMERPAAASRSPFVERERQAADLFAAAARAAGVRRIVYLGGLMPTPAHDERAVEQATGGVSRHLASRAEVEAILLAGAPDSLSLRASIVIGARSRSFRLLVRLIERMPVLTLPSWHGFRTQPIDARDVIEMLAACATSKLSGRSLDIGGPDALTYGDMLIRIADAMLVNRPTVKLSVNATAFTARVAAAIAGEEPELVLPLMEGLQGDLLPADDQTAQQLGVHLHTFDAAVEHALGEWERAEPLAAR